MLMRSDIVDYELDRSGNYMAATVSATYNFIDQIVSSLGTLIATLCVAAIGYTTVMPQPTDEATFGIRVVAAFLTFLAAECSKGNGKEFLLRVVGIN